MLAATILVIATNAGLIGVSRLAYSLGQHRQIPPVLGRVHPKRMTPYVSIIVFGVVACLIILPGSTFFLADLYAFGAMISFTAAHISVVALRIKEPELRRPFRTPLSIPFRGKSLPLLSIIGGIGTFTVWCVVVATHAEGRLIGFSWMAIGFVVYVVYRKAKGYSLTKTVEKVVVPISMQTDIDYDQILVPITGTRISDEMMVLACQLATEKKSAIDGLYVIEVPLNLPLDARLVSERAKADTVLKAGALIASQFKVKFTPHVVTARQAGRAIVEEAAKRRSEVIMLGHDAQAPHRQPDVREDDGLRARPRAVRGPPQPGPQGLSYGGLEHRRQARAAGADASRRRRRRTGRPKREGLRRMPCMS